MDDLDRVAREIVYDHVHHRDLNNAKWLLGRITDALKAERKKADGLMGALEPFQSEYLKVYSLEKHGALEVLCRMVDRVLKSYKEGGGK